MEKTAFFPSQLITMLADQQKICPIFVGESAYVEKGIAFILVEELFMPDTT